MSEHLLNSSYIISLMLSYMHLFYGVYCKEGENIRYSGAQEQYYIHVVHHHHDKTFLLSFHILILCSIAMDCFF